jgi:hypothetical protein
MDQLARNPGWALGMVAAVALGVAVVGWPVTTAPAPTPVRAGDAMDEQEGEEEEEETMRATLPEGQASPLEARDHPAVAPGRRRPHSGSHRPSRTLPLIPHPTHTHHHSTTTSSTSTSNSNAPQQC